MWTHQLFAHQRDHLVNGSFSATWSKLSWQDDPTFTQNHVGPSLNPLPVKALIQVSSLYSRCNEGISFYRISLTYSLFVSDHLSFRQYIFQDLRTFISFFPPSHYFPSLSTHILPFSSCCGIHAPSTIQCWRQCSYRSFCPFAALKALKRFACWGKSAKQENLPPLHGLVFFRNDKNTKMFVGHSEGVLAYFSLTDSTICYHLLVHPFLPFLSCCTNFQKWWLCQQQILQQILYPCVKNHFKGTCTLFGYGHMWVLKHWSVIGITISHVLDCSPVSLSGLWSK